MKKDLEPNLNPLYSEIIRLVEESRNRAYSQINVNLTMMYWQVGKHISLFILDNGRADYGKQILPTLSVKLTNLYGKGFSERHLRNMIQFYDFFPENILQSLIAKLTWTHFIQLLSIKDELQREFYATLCFNEHWSVRTLKERIHSMLFERTAISNKPELTIKNDLQKLRENKEMSLPLVLKDPYVLNFLGLADTYSEKDLEQAIVIDLQNFILEIGNDFAFLARQKRITIDHEDYYLDLLFFHRKLNRLVAIELKLGNFEYQHKAQMELYLRYLKKYEQNPTENTPIGIILCANKSEELVELLELDEQGIHIATYFTELPKVELLKAKLKQAVANSKLRFENLENELE
jgi:predicted nuclease of restriction endonuclease-like (RecB) superfamily